MANTNNTKQAAWVAIGSFFSFLVGIVSPMILSRFFSKSDYGTYKQVMFVYNTLLTVFTLGLPKAYAYFLPKAETKYSKDIIQKITKIFFFLGLAFSAFLFVCANPIAKFLKNDDLALAIRIFSPVPMLMLPTMGIDGIYASFKKTQFSALYHILTRVLTIVCIVIPVAFFHGTYIEAIIGFDVASLISCIVALTMKSLPVRNTQQEKSDLTYKKIFAFSLPLFYASLWGVVYSSANQFFISRYYGNEVFAEFSNGFMELPFIGMILSAISAVLLPSFSRLEKGNGFNDDVCNVWISSLLKSAKLVFPMSVFCIVFAKTVMTCLYGNLYENSTIYFQIKNLSGLFYIIPFAPILLAVGKTKTYANVTAIFAIIIVILESICVRVFESALPIAIVSETLSITRCIVFLFVVVRISSRSFKQLVPIKELGRVLFLTLLSGLITCFVLNFFTMNKFVLLFVSLGSFVVLYYILCFAMKVSYKEIICSLVPSIKKSLIYKIIP